MTDWEEITLNTVNNYLCFGRDYANELNKSSDQLTETETETMSINWDNSYLRVTVGAQ